MGEETQAPDTTPTINIPIGTKLQLAGAAEGAVILGVSKARFNQLAGKDDFPPPLGETEMGRVWFAPHLIDYGSTRPRRSGRVPVVKDAGQA